MTVKEFLEKYGKNKNIKKWEFLYKSWDNDNSLYFIKKWEILLQFNWKTIAIVWENEISWEKSFLEWTGKPIDAIANEDLEVLYISYDDFQNIDFDIQKEFLKSLVLFVSNRVYLLNDVISNLDHINTQVIEKQPKLDINYLNWLFKFIDLKNIYIYKLFDGNLFPIFESKLDFSLQEKVKNCSLKNIDIKHINDSLIIAKIHEFIIVLEWNKNVSDYIVNNVLIHSVWSLKYLCFLLEEERNKDLNSFLD